ncbi:triose-phosphate isomerase [Parasphingorhabdus sp. DH2-15]|uniref:triose-phosphate isomerase n=1 Tax=Parasphingorhabdus sp. DH2-15 TaxID=3444112 RepID=UPI003F685624
MRPFIVANWKMHGLKADMNEVKAIDSAAAKFDHIDVGIGLPATLIHLAAQNAGHAQIGAQDCHQAQQGAHTGCLSAAMLSEAGASFSIVGHSERRADQAETSRLIAQKARSLQNASMGAILCIGEDLATRQSGTALDFVAGQLVESLALADDTSLSPERLTIAYEPIWAIGTGHVPELTDIAAMHSKLRSQLVSSFGPAGDAIRILYGGSVKASNAKDILALKNVNGALVGGASLKAESFVPIIAAA